MRISDWSSDVCSSDLRRVDAAFSVHPPVRPSVAHEPLQIFIVRRQDDRRLPLVAVAQESLAIALHGAKEIIEIGVLAIAGGMDARRIAVDRTSVWSGESVSVRVDHGGARSMK